MNSSPALSGSTLVISVLLFLVALLLARPVLAQTDSAPTILISEAPPRGAGPDRVETIAGRVRGVNTQQHKVVLYALGDVWYVQPFSDAPFTSINPDGSFTASIHLGTKYAALLVSDAYQRPPATTAALPSVGGNILARSVVAAGSRNTVIEEPTPLMPASVTSDAAQAAAAPVLSIEAQAPQNSPTVATNWLPLWGLICLLALIALSQQAETFAVAIGLLLTGLLTTGQNLSQAMWQTLLASLPQGPEEALTEKHPKSVLALVGLIVLTIGCGASYADYFNLNQSVVIVWPLESTSWILAATLVAVQAMIGLLLHYLEHKPLRRFFWTVLVLVLVSEFLFSYMRTIEVEEFKRMQLQAALSGEFAQTMDKVSYLQWSFQAALAGLITVVCGLAETLGIYGGFRLAAWVLVWVLALPLLAVTGICYGVFQLLALSKVAEALKVCLAAILRAVAAVCAFIAACLVWFWENLCHLPLTLQHGSYNWLERRARRRAALAALPDELTREQLHARELSAKHQQHRMRLQANWHEMLEVACHDLLTRIRETTTELNRRLSAAIAEKALAELPPQAQAVATQLLTAKAGAFREVAYAYHSLNGHRPIPHAEKAPAESTINTEV